jgi:drug/metabolite transporter (DMT)-like permease
VAGAATAWGTWPLWLRHAQLGGYGQAFAVLSTLALAGLPFAVTASRRRPPRSRGILGALALMGLFDAANNGLYFASLTHGSVAAGVLTHYFAPVLVAASAPLLLGESLSRRTVGAVVLAMAGLTLLVEPWRGSHPPLGAALGFASSILYAGNVIVAKRLAERITAIEINTYHAIVSAALLLPLGLPQVASAPAGLTTLVPAALALGLVAGLAFYAGLERIPAQQAGILTYLEPVVAVLVGSLGFHEPLPALAIGGGGLVILAGMLVVSDAPPERFL